MALIIQSIGFPRNRYQYKVNILIRHWQVDASADDCQHSENYAQSTGLRTTCFPTRRLKAQMELTSHSLFLSPIGLNRYYKPGYRSKWTGSVPMLSWIPGAKRSCDPSRSRLGSFPERVDLYLVTTYPQLVGPSEISHNTRDTCSKISFFHEYYEIKHKHTQVYDMIGVQIESRRKFCSQLKPRIEKREITQY